MVYFTAVAPRESLQKTADSYWELYEEASQEISRAEKQVEAAKRQAEALLDIYEQYNAFINDLPEEKLT